VLTLLHEADPRIKAIFLSRNFGQSAALTAGIEAAKGDAIIVMDADGQDPPEVLPALIAKWKQGYEVVGGRRASRRGEPLLKRALAFLWYRVMRLLIGWDMPLDTGEFRIIDRVVADVFLACPQRHRLVRTLTSWPGFRQATVDYHHGPRHAGNTKYTLGSSLRLAITSITGFSLVPLRIAFALGIVILASSIASCAWIVFAGLRGEFNYMALAIAGLWALGGLQCILIGILGEYIGRTYIEMQHRPLYVVRDSIGIED
jgi:dolichol-phosphate mannosyltransferase